MLGRRRKSDEVVVAARAGGLVLDGTATAVERFAERVERLASSSALAEVAAVGLAVKQAVDQLPSTRSAGAALVELSPRAVELLREHGAIAAGDGFFRSMVHDGKHLAGNLDWKPVSSPTDLAQLQSSAVGLALQASLKNLADAVARVEQQVSVVSDLIRSEQFGDVLGHHRVLQRLLDMTADGSELSSTDWHSIDQMRVDITTSLERTRLFVRGRIDAAESGWLTRTRADAAADLIDSGLIDTMGILAVCEQNLAGWHQLRLLRVRATESEQLDKVVQDIEGDLALHRADDEALAGRLVELLDEFVDSTGFEGFEPRKRRSLQKSVGELRTATERFVAERNLDVAVAGHGVLPGTADSLRAARDRARTESRRVGGAVAGRIRRGKSSTEASEVEPSAEGPIGSLGGASLPSTESRRDAEAD